jgi:hypothetical protein
VLLRELFFREDAQAKPTKKLGRAFNHLEDLVFFHGSQGTLEALNHLKEIATQEGAQTIRMKWDGAPQVYWGRETKGGPLILSGHNGWARGAKSTNPNDVYDFIVNQSGKPKTPEEEKARQAFGKQFANLYPLFDAATPKDFVGFVYADSLFLNRPPVDEQGVYNFCPNPKSQTCYHVRADSELGQRIANAQVMVVGHAYFPEFGMSDDSQKPMDDFSMFNSTPGLIVQEPIYNSSTLSVDTTKIAQAEKYLATHAANIDGFLAGVPGMSDLKEILYKFVNQTAKAKQLDSIGSQAFFNWLSTSGVSAPKQQKIQELSKQFGSALDAIFTLVRMIQDVKDDVIDQLESGHSADIWDTQGEGRVRYAGQGKQFGNVKLVPRKRWTP